MRRLKTEMPELWDRAFLAVRLEEERLEMIGFQAGSPERVLAEALERLNERLGATLPSLDVPSVGSIAQRATVGEPPRHFARPSKRVDS